MHQAHHGDQEVEAEEKDLDELGLSKAQDEDAWQVGHGHTGKHLEGNSQASGRHKVSRWGSVHAPPLTALPMETVASLALSSRLGLVLMAKERVMCDTNSTDMPTACGQRTGFRGG